MSNKYTTVPREVEAIQFNFDNLKSTFMFLDLRDISYNIKNKMLSGIISIGNEQKLSVNNTDYIVKDSDGTISVWKSEDFKNAFIEEN